MRSRSLNLLLLSAILATSMLAAPAAAQTQLWTQPTTPTVRTIGDLKGGGPLGMGFSVGTRNGMTLKIWPARGYGIVLELGAPPYLNSMALSLGFRGHFKPLSPPGNSVAALPYIGASFRLRMMFMPGQDPSVFAEMGAVIPFGVSIVWPQFPVELFVEAGPVLAFWKGPGFGIDVDGIAGARIYF